MVIVTGSHRSNLGIVTYLWNSKEKRFHHQQALQKAEELIFCNGINTVNKDKTCGVILLHGFYLFPWLCTVLDLHGQCTPPQIPLAAFQPHRY